jgi:heme exporter protein A
MPEFITGAGGAELLAVDSLVLERGGRRLLTDFNLRVGAGELVLIEGDNGSGKTSLLRSLAGLARYGYTGTIERRADSILYLGHKPGLKGLLTPRENLAWYCRSQGLGSGGIDAALAAVDLVGFEDVLCHNLSAGQQRRVNLARLYLPAAPLWLLDEPFTAIDRAGVAALVQILVRQVEQGGAVVMTSHQPLETDYPVTRLMLGRD